MISPGDQGGSLTNGWTHGGTSDVGDLDVWTVEANVGESIVVRMGELTNVVFAPQLRIYRPDGTLEDTTTANRGRFVSGRAARKIKSGVRFILPRL